MACVVFVCLLLCVLLAREVVYDATGSSVHGRWTAPQHSLRLDYIDRVE